MGIFHRSELFFYLGRANLWKTVRYLYPLSLAMMCAKFLTYTSYGLIPVSLTHTVKALQPFFNVLLVFVWTRESVDSSTFLSLIPIVFGVIYASVNEIECFLGKGLLSCRFNWSGFICALLSTIIGVWQSIYLKMLMHMGMDRNYVLLCDWLILPVQVHLCNGLLSCCILFPIVVFFEVRRSTYQMIRWDHVFISAFLQYLSSISSYSV